jgi:spermidine synthase
MRWAADAELLTGALAASIMSQGLPVGLLGLLTPMLLRAGNLSPNEAISDSAVGGSPGRWSGAVLAAGGAGGIAGALGMGLWLIPSLGLSRSYGVLSAALLILLAPAAAAERRWALGLASALLTAALIAGWGRGGVASSESTRIIQSTHGQLDIRRVGGRRTLLIDGLPQTALDGPVAPGEALRHGCLLEAALTGFRPRQALVIGLGAGLAPRVLAAHGVPCESVELDARVAEVAREAFGFDGPVTIADGRTFLARDPRRWDLIVLDVCTAERLAWRLFTVEAFRLVRARLAPEGRLAIQFITAGEGDWPASLARTVEEVFGRGVILEPAASLVPVMPCWLLAGRLPPAPPPDARTDPTVPWRVRPWPAGGARLTDDHFAAERDWSRTAHCWRRLYGQRPGGP